MLVVSVLMQDIENLWPKLETLGSDVDAIELRWDGVEEFNYTWVYRIRDMVQKPLIFTLRREDQGGHFQGPEHIRLEHIKALCALKPDYFDIEYDVDVSGIQNDFPSLKLIGSYHDLTGHGLTIEAFLQAVAGKCFALLKYARFCPDAWASLQLFHEGCNQQQTSVIAIGQAASFVRLLGPVMGNRLDYASLSDGHETALGQISVKAWHEIYGYHRLNRQTKVYGLLGQPVDKSLGHIWHNHFFKTHDINALYVKIDIDTNHLNPFLELAPRLGFLGFSVTMPHKKTAALITQSSLQAVNTLKWNDDGWVTCNTDGMGALKALNLKDASNILILGDGASAKAIGKACQNAGHQVHYIYRGEQHLEGRLDWQSINTLDIDGVIQTIPTHAYSNANPMLDKVKYLLKPLMWVMDINYNQQAPFSEYAVNLGCRIIDGYQMFEAQACYQQQYWGLD